MFTAGNSMNVLICDDIISEAQNLAAILNDSQYGINTVVFDNGSAALAYVLSGAVVDVCFLDIIMPGMSGIELAEGLRKYGYAGKIVFLSTSNEYAMESYAVKAFAYMLKPPSPERVGDILHDLESARKNADTNGILVKQADRTRFLLFRELSHIEVVKRYVYFRLIDGGETAMRTTFSEVAGQLLTDSRFVRCHRSFIVNMDAISHIQGSAFIMRDGAKITISRNYSEAEKQYLRWVLGGGRLC